MEMVKLFAVEDAADVNELQELLHRFWQYTGSERPWRIERDSAHRENLRWRE